VNVCAGFSRGVYEEAAPKPVGGFVRFYMNRRNLLRGTAPNIFSGISLWVVLGFLAFGADLQLPGSEHQLAESRIFVDPDLRVSYDGYPLLR
jgi:hypothetical protein